MWHRRTTQLAALAALTLASSAAAVASTTNGREIAPDPLPSLATQRPGAADALSYLPSSSRPDIVASREHVRALRSRLSQPTYTAKVTGLIRAAGLRVPVVRTLPHPTRAEARQTAGLP